MTAEKRRETWAAIAILSLAIVLHVAVVVRNFAGPIGDTVESFVYEYLTHTFSNHIHLWPIPKLDLFHPEALFPYGTSGALQSWCVERELFAHGLRKAFGEGPWLQWYYVFGLVVGTFGTFALLRDGFGTRRAVVAALIANVFNVYAAQKYPIHHNMAVVHWATLSIVLDFVIYQTIADRKIPSFRILLLRVLILVLSFGLELGHVLGFALTSLFATCVCVLVMLVSRVVRERHSVRAGVGDVLAAWRADIRDHKAACAALVGATLVFAWFYGMLVRGIVHEALSFQFDEKTSGVWWAHPIRMLIPDFPWIHPGQQPRFLTIFGDVAEVGIGANGVGWSLLILALVALWQQRARLWLYAPLLASLIAYVVSRPGFDLIRWLPWFSHMRVLSRATVVYSVIFALLCIRVRMPEWSRRTRTWATAAFASLALLELFTVVRLKLKVPAYSFSTAFMDHQRRIEALPGVAVLDFPFCILGGNGAIGRLCPLPEKQKAIFALQRFHHKSVIGHYLGRLHPSQVEPFVRAGWPALELADDDDQWLAHGIDRCPTPKQMEVFSDFYYKNDFVGIQLAVELLPEGCAETFYARFGKPMGEVSIPTAGRLTFIPRDPATRDRINPAEGKNVRFPQAMDEPTEFVRARVRNTLMSITHSLSGFEYLPDGREWRWGLGPSTDVTFESVDDRELAIDLRFYSPFEYQVIDVILDGKNVGRLDDLSTSGLNTRSLVVPVGAGSHVLVFKYKLANEGETKFAPEDGRAMTVKYESFRLELREPR